jgi:hypothetical protein
MGVDKEFFEEMEKHYKEDKDGFQEISDDYKELDENFWKELAEEEDKRRVANKLELDFVKTNIDYDIELIEEMLGDIDSWNHIGFVEIEKTDYKAGGYQSYDFFKIKDSDDKKYYMKQDMSDENTFHNLVWQTVGYCEDDYSGFLLFPLKDGRYWKVSYSC